MWQSILISFLIKVLPLLAEWAQEWLKSRLEAQAAQQPALVGALDPKAGQLHLLHKVRAELWPWQFAKKAVVDEAINHVINSR